MFGLPAAFYVDDDSRRQAALARRASLANTTPGKSAPQGSVSLPASRIPSRATSRKPSLSGLGGLEGENGEAVPPSRTVSTYGSTVLVSI